MVKYLRILVALMVTMFATSAMAFNPPPAPAVGSIVDTTGTLTQSEIRDLNMQLRQVNQNTSNQIGILVIPSPGGENMRDIGYATGKAWKVGQAGVDNGVMIVWARHNDQGGPGQVTIETGKGVEGDLPDLKCNDIIANVLRPHFRNKQFAGGLSAAISAINTSIGDHRAALQAQRDKENSLRQNGANPPADNGNAVAAGGAPQPSTSHGCDVSGSPVQQAGVGGFLFWVVLLLVAVWAVRRWFAKMGAQSVLEQERQRKIDDIHAHSAQRRREEEAKRAALREEEDRHLAELNAQLRATQAEQEARERAARVVPAPIPAPVVVPVVVAPPPVQYEPLATATAVTATAVVAERIRQEREEEERRQVELAQARRERELREAEERRAERARQAAADEEIRQERLARARQEREDREEAEAAAAAAAAIAAAAVIATSNDDDSSPSSGSSCSSSCSSSSGSSCSSSSDTSSSCSSSSGGGDIGGGGSDGGACSS